MRLLRAPLPLLLLSTTLLSGCAGGGGGSKTNPGGSLKQSNDFVLNANVVELDKTQATVVSVTDGTVVLTGAPSLTAGQILVHNALDGTRFLRKVVSATVSGGTTTVTTTDADVTEVFKSANIAQDTYMSQADLLASLQPAVDGLTIEAASKGASRDATIDNIPKVTLNFNNLTLKDNSGNSIVDVNGSVTLGAGVETIWRQSGLNPLPSEVGVSGLTYVSGQLKAHAHSAGSFTTEIPLTVKGAGIPIAGIGPLGVNLNIQLLLKVEGSFTADGDFVATATISAGAGVHYDNTNHWTFTTSFDKLFSLQPPTLRGQVDFGISLVRPAVSIDVLRMGEVGLKSDVMKVLAKISGQTSPVPGFLVEGYGDFDFTAFGSLKVGPWTLWQDERSYDLGKFSIVKPFLLKTLGATDTQIAYVEPTRTKLHVMNGDGTGDSVLYTANVAVFSPDVSSATKKICFVALEPKTYQPTLYTVSGGKVSGAVALGGLQPANPSWSPNGTEIAFDALDTAGARQIYVVNISTLKVRKLTSEVLDNGGNDPRARAQQSGAATEPCWSPDGTKIYYQRLYYGVTSIAITSSSQHTDGVALANDTLNYTDPNLSPSGTMLVAKRSDRGIVISDELGRNERTVLSSTIYSHPRFSPDGTSIVVQEDDNSKLVSFDLNGGSRKTLATGISPSWGLR